MVLEEVNIFRVGKERSIKSSPNGFILTLEFL
jgi:hypothetical protein